MARKLPVYLLLDTSGSMYGEPIEAVKTGLDVLANALKSEPYALETAWLSVITFNDTAQQVVALTEVASFKAPPVIAGGCTALGSALSLAVDCIEREVTKNTKEIKGDWKPLVFIFTDGEPTEDITQGVEKLRSCKTGVVVACAAGAGAHTATLKRITENVVRLDEADSASIKAYFKWISASMSVVSKRIDQAGSDPMGMDDLPPRPPKISIN